MSKLVAGREKDLNYVRALNRFNLINASTLKDRLAQTPLRPELRKLCEERLRAVA